jgi:hypothetical protein
MVQALKLILGVVLLFFLLAAHAQQIPTCTITAQPATATGSADVTVEWATTGAQTCVATGGWSGPKDCAGGSQVMQDVTQNRTFTLKVAAATGKVTARWTKPTQNTDGSPATVTGYKLYVADSAAQLPTAQPIALPATPLEYVFWRPPGNVTAGIKAVRSDSVESGLSNVASKNVLAASGTCSATVTISPRPKAPTLTITWLKEFLSGKRRGDADET